MSNSLAQSLKWLDEWLVFVRSIGNPGVVTLVSIGLLFLGANVGLFQVSLRRHEGIRQSHDEWGAFRFALWHSVTDAIFYTLITVPLLLWRQWWLTGPAVVVYAATVLPTILQDVIFVFASLGLIITSPQKVVPILGGTCAKLGGDALVVIYLALLIRSLWT